MSGSLRKAVCFDIVGVKRPGPGERHSVDFQPIPGNFYNLNIIADSQTRWARIWVDLSTLWPAFDVIDQARLDSLDYQLALLKVYGCGTILTIGHEIPAGINEAPSPTRAPLNTDIGGPWHVMFSAVASRYSLANSQRPYSGYSYADIIEFCNEPNLLWAAAPNRTLPQTVANLFKRAKEVSASLGNTPLIGGPALADAGPDLVARRRNYFDFTADVCAALNGNGFYDVGSNASCLWTHHNYTDVVFDHGLDSIAPDVNTYNPDPARPALFDRRNLRARKVVDNLPAFGWRGWPAGNVNDPRIFLTEGGAQGQILTGPVWGITDSDTKEAYRAFLGGRNMQRMEDATLGRGVEMWTHYQLITKPEFDTGLFDFVSLLPRAVYSAIWRTYPSRV